MGNTLNLLNLLKGIPAKYAAKRMTVPGIRTAEFDTLRFQRFCKAVALNSKTDLAARKKDLSKLLELLPADYSIILMEAIEKGHPGLVKQIREENSVVDSRLNNIEKTEFVATLFLSGRVRRCAETAQRLMGD